MVKDLVQQVMEDEKLIKFIRDRVEDEELDREERDIWNQMLEHLKKEGLIDV